LHVRAASGRDGYILGGAQIVDKTTVLGAQTLPRVQRPNRDGFVPDPRPELLR